MKSRTHPSFWKAYKHLTPSVQKLAKKVFLLWKENPFHPSLYFKCINRAENIWAIRITLGYRALCIFEKETATWFWIGSHKDYERFF